METRSDKTAAYLTHELRAPLQALKFALELLGGGLEDGATDRNKRMLDAAVCTTERMKTLIDDILEMSRVQMGKASVDREACAPRDLVLDTVRFFAPWAERKKVFLSAFVEKDCPAVSAEPRRMVQALTNLISNALKFTPPGGTIEVRISRGRRERAGFVVFSVRDTGRGISAQDLLRIFRYFEQAGSAEDRAQGTGLGLPLARSFVELQGGELWAKSRLGEGSTFSFSLPVYLKRSEAPEETGEAPESAKAAERRAR